MISTNRETNDLEKPTMKYAICNETFGQMPLDEALSMAAAAGYQGWEVAPFMLADHVDAFDQKQRRDYRQKVTDAGLRIIGLHWLLARTTGLHLTTADATVRRRTTEHFRKLAQLAGDLCGDTGGVMVLGSPGQRNRTEGQSTEQAMRRAAEVIAGFTDVLEDQNVRLALEPLGPEEGDFLNTADEAAQLMAMIDHPNVGLHLDVKAMSTEPDPITAVMQKHLPATFHFHANDPNRQGPGMGEVDFEPIIAVLKDSGYDRWVSVEVFDYSPGVRTLVDGSIANLRAAGG